MSCIYQVYLVHSFKANYAEMRISISIVLEIRGICHTYTAAIHIHGIYMVYTDYIPRWGSRGWLEAQTGNSSSSSQLQPNISWSRIPVNCCQAAPLPSLADSESLRAEQQWLPVGQQSVPAWTPLASNLHSAVTLAMPPK